MSKLSDRFLLERETGSGGMARVFVGRDEVLDRPVAVKILRSAFDGSEIAARFRREGRTAARLSHPNIVQVFDAGRGEFEGQVASYIVMEYLPGGDLKELLDAQGPLPDQRLCALAAGVCAGLAHAHGRGVVHRDIKPHNILLDENGEPKLADFGIAHALGVTTSNQTRTGAYLGTALYSAPEQLQGEKVTPKSDVYSLGATLYQAATGRAPFTGSPISVANQHVTKDPVPPREINASVGGGLEAAILSCLAKDPDERPTAQELRTRLEGLEDAAKRTAKPPAAAPQAAAPSAESRPPDPDPQRQAPGRPGFVVRRRRRPWALLAILAALALVGAVAAPLLLQGKDDQASHRTPARQTSKSPNVSAKAPADAGRTSQKKSTNARVAAAQQPPPATTAEQSLPAATPQTTQSIQAQTTQETSAQSTQAQTTQAQTTQAQGALTQEAAARTVEDFYNSAAAGDYGQSANYLTTGFRQSVFPNTATFEGTFKDLESVRFLQGPDVQLSGNTATVTGTTLATHTYGTDRHVGTWTLVPENGRWKISQQQVGPA